ncbi:MAG TPA: PH domain-containing protein, partial [Mycobacteriales bacterium]|nr:PH domain-containing protein [Mycobacteriales bacterium]
MAYPKKLLSQDETVVLEAHPHWKVLVVPFLELLVILAVAGFSFARFDQGWARWTTVGLGLLLALVLFGLPLLRWR